MTAPIRINWTRNRILATVALFLGVLALAGNPERGSTVTLDTRELATVVGTTADHVTTGELADWIVRGAADYRLIDLRSDAEYATYHIPTAEAVPIERLLDHGLDRNEKIVLYSDGGIHAAQAWFLLKAQKYPGAYLLLGGLEAWKEEILYPVAPADADPTMQARFERAVQLSRFFGGSPRAASDAAPTALPAPAPAPTDAALQPPAARLTVPPTGKSPAPAPRKKKEGC